MIVAAGRMGDVSIPRRVTRCGISTYEPRMIVCERGLAPLARRVLLPTERPPHSLLRQIRLAETHPTCPTGSSV